MTTRTETKEPMHIVELKAENFKRLKAVRIMPTGKMVIIEGVNGAGKSSVIDAIAAAIGGGKWKPEKVIRAGEKRAAVYLNLGRVTISRRWSQHGQSFFEVVPREGETLPESGPQGILDAYHKALPLDPVAFERMSDKDQGDALRAGAGLDFTTIDGERAQLYAERTGVNRTARSARARVGDSPAKPDPAEPIDVDELSKKREAAIVHNRMVDERDWELAKAKQDLTDATTRLAAAQKVHDDAGARVDEVKRTQLVREDDSSIVEQMEAANTHNLLVAKRDSWKQLDRHACELEESATVLSDKIEALDGKKDELLKAAKFPLEGLSVDENGVTLNGIPFSQASSAERLRAAVAISLADKPEIRVVLIRDGSLLDETSMGLLGQLADEFNAQMIIERVADTASPAAVFIEDGEVVEQGAGSGD